MSECSDPVHSVSLYSPREERETIAYTIGFTRHVEWPALELAEVFEEDRDKCRNVFGSFFSSALR